MHLEEAFSLQLAQHITAERAYELFWAGTINDKRAFQCPGEGCTAQVTCANLDTLEHDLKVQPHYRPYGEHIEGCPFSEKGPPSSTSSGTKRRDVSTPAVQTADVFNLSRPNDHFSQLTSTTPSSPKGTRKAGSGGHAQSDGRPRQRHYYSVTNIVQRWLRFRKKNLLSEVEIRIGTNVLTYEKLFKGVYNQDAKSLEKAQHIYWGKAWASRIASNTGYRIEFNNKMNTEGLLRRPSVLIRDDMIEGYPLKKLLIKRLTKAIEENNGGCILFIYGTPIIVPDLRSTTTLAQNTRSFINFNTTSLDMIDIQNVNLFKQLKRNR
ncbi:hypothetical protein [Dyella agri]|uniref:Uncharacterized protein n=1 Tax=Dyella agri TaxID=1926869 RepID=A0ABW8KKR8_9GAMM